MKDHKVENWNRHYIIKYLVYFIIASPGLFLLSNLFPVPSITSFSVLLGLGIFFIIYNKSITSSHYEIITILLIIYLYFLASFLLSNQKILSFFSYRFFKYDGSIYYSYLPFIFLGASYFDYKKALNIFLKFVFLVLSVFAVFGIIEYFYGEHLLLTFEKGGEIYFRALNFAHNATGSVYSLVCIFLLIFFLGEKKRSIKVLYLLGLLLCASALLITRSRGGYIGFLSGSIFSIWFYYRKVLRFIIVVLIIFLVLGSIFMLTGTFDRLASIFDFNDPNIKARFSLWNKAWEMFRQSPILGVGFGRFNDVKSYSSSITWGMPGFVSFIFEPDYDYNSAHAHNSYLHFLAETGFLGLSLILLFWMSCFKKLYRANNNINDNFSKIIFPSCMGAVIALMVMSLTENYLASVTVITFISMVTSLAIGLYWQNEKQVKSA